jgi:hypothetical protein
MNPNFSEMPENEPVLVFYRKRLCHPESLMAHSAIRRGDRIHYGNKNGDSDSMNQFMGNPLVENIGWLYVDKNQLRPFQGAPMITVNKTILPDGSVHEFADFSGRNTFFDYPNWFVKTSHKARYRKKKEAKQ